MYLFEIILRRLSRQKDDCQFQVTGWLASGRAVKYCVQAVDIAGSCTTAVAERMFFTVCVYTVMAILA
jgi:hypothetical protein